MPRINALFSTPTMGTDAETSKNALEHRRWLIGISITVVFGLFGVVMALLAYADRTKPAATPSVAPAAAPARGHGDKDKDKGRGR